MTTAHKHECSCCFFNDPDDPASNEDLTTCKRLGHICRLGGCRIKCDWDHKQVPVRPTGSLAAPSTNQLVAEVLNDITKYCNWADSEYGKTYVGATLLKAIVDIIHNSQDVKDFMEKSSTPQIENEIIYEDGEKL